MFFKFKPQLKQLLWGGEKILSFKHLDTPMKQVGESWEISDVPGNESIVQEGEFAGYSLPQLIALLKGQLVGEKVYKVHKETFPLLIKFIDAKKDLSLQVHPNDALALQRHGCMGKTEMWYVIQADEGASLCSGFAKQINPNEYETWINSPLMMEAVSKHSLHAGDVFYLPAGRVHSIGAGSFIAEIQQTSNITYRLYDYNRLDSNGQPRQLHIEEAKDAIDFKLHDDYKTPHSDTKNERVPLVACPKFITSLFDLTQTMEMDYSRLDSFVIYMAIEGKGSLTNDAGNAVPLQSGETVLIAANTQRVTINPEQSLKFLEVYV